MQSLKSVLLESWDRQATIINNLADLIQPDQMNFVVTPGEWPIGEHLCHIHGTRRFWMRDMNPEYLNGLERLVVEKDGEWVPISDLALIREQLKDSAVKIREIMDDLLDHPTKVGSYDHPVYFLQHMIWHEGWHTSSILSALRVNGQEPDESWEEPNIWGLWRTEEFIEG